MAQWTKKYTPPEKLNEGAEYTEDSDVTLDTFNAANNNAFYAVEQSKKATETANKALEHAQKNGTQTFINNEFQSRLDFASDPQQQISAISSDTVANTNAISEIETKLSNKWNKSYTILSAVTKIQLKPNEKFFGIIVLSGNYGDFVIDTDQGILENFGTAVGKIIMIGQNVNIFTISFIMTNKTTKYYSIDVSNYQKVELRSNDMYGVLYEFKL